MQFLILRKKLHMILINKNIFKYKIKYRKYVQQLHIIECILSDKSLYTIIKKNFNYSF